MQRRSDAGAPLHFFVLTGQADIEGTARAPAADAGEQIF
jgi:hypothetical protein